MPKSVLNLISEFDFVINDFWELLLKFILNVFLCSFEFKFFEISLFLYKHILLDFWYGNLILFVDFNLLSNILFEFLFELFFEIEFLFLVKDPEENFFNFI